MKGWEEMNHLLTHPQNLKRAEFLEAIAKDVREEQKHLSKEVTRSRRGCSERFHYNIPVVFDIETTNDDNSQMAFMYHWQLCFNGYTTTGRTWQEFFELLAEIRRIYAVSRYIHLRVYIHNLAYEAAFLLPRLKIDRMFATDKRTPLYIETADGFDFFDSYILSGLSLAKTAENLTYFHLQKMEGDLDYSKSRNSFTPLTETELGYCVADVTTLCGYIWEQIHDAGEITKIPLTNTGRVRQYVREHTLKKKNEKGQTVCNKEYSEKIHELNLSPEEYLDLRSCFMGGYTHAGHLHTGEIVKDVQSLDFSSSYPGRMAEFRFPMSSGVKIYYKDLNDYKKDIQRGFLVVALCELYDLTDQPFSFEHYLSRSKCIMAEGVIEDNGRIVSADKIVIWLTNVDLEIVAKTYNCRIRIVKAWRYKAGYLPTEYVACVLHFYQQKTKLKGIPEQRVEYQKFKGMNNGIYGMSVTDIVHDSYDYDPNQDEPWSTTTADIEESIKRYNKNKKRFDFYPWGVFVTAWARWELWQGILELREDYLYSDTDSVKYTNPEKHTEFFRKHNEQIRLRIQAEEAANGLEYSIPKTIKGKEKPLGEWDFDGRYKRFKTLGAKRYMYEDEDGLHITIAGISKQNGLEYIKKQKDPFRFFSDGMAIPAEYSGKTVAKYTDHKTEAVIVDEFGNREKMKELSGVYITNSSYEMTMSQIYLDYIRGDKMEGRSIHRLIR